MRRINLKDFIKSGEGATATSYDSPTDNTILLKMFNSGYPVDSIRQEIDIVKKVISLGVPTPEPGESVTDGEHTGVIFHRITNKRSYSRMLADEVERLEEFAEEFARKSKELHSIKCPKGMFPRLKDNLLFYLEKDKVFSKKEKIVIEKFIKEAPDTDNALHGDLQMGNLISTLKKGEPMSTPHDVYFIDLGSFQTGHYLFDLGMMEMICLYCNDEYLEHDFHIDRQTAVRFWRCFIKYYFGNDTDYDEVCKLVDKYCYVKCLQVEYFLGSIPENYIVPMRRAFGFE